MAIIATIALSACGNGSTTTEQTDSTEAQVDSAAVTATDSTVAEIPAEGGVEKPTTEAVK